MKKLLFITATLFSVFALGQSTGQNYIMNTTYKVPTTETLNPTDAQKKQNVTYFDGLGRPIQKIAKAQSATAKDIITHIEYDSFGRQTMEYLPFSKWYGDSSLNFFDSAQSATLSYYSTFDTTVTGNPYFEQSSNPYSEKRLENSPLNRVLEQAAPGNDWAMNNTEKHTVRFDYQTNDFEEVRLYRAETTWNATKELYDITFNEDDYYLENTLYKTITKDENWESGSDNTTEEFKDKEGRVILKRTYNNGKKHDTYYVYDEYGNLTYVLPPMVDTSLPITSDVLDGLCYQYKYDNRNRLVEKKLPGKQWEFIVYNSQDMVVATGPALHPFGGTDEGWMVTKYDIFGRVAYTGWYNGEAATSAGRVDVMTTLSASNWAEKRIGTAQSLDGFEINYTNDAFPKMDKLLTVTYYDNYNYKGAPTPSSIPTQIEDQAVATNVKTLPTGSWVRVLDKPETTKGDFTHTFYDKKARVIRSLKETYLGGFTQVDTKLDFIGKTLYTTTTHKRTNEDDLLTVRDEFEYTEQDRLLVHKHQINNNPWQLLAKNDYDELGQLISKQVGGEDVTTYIGLQKVDFSYNIRGWLKGINNIDELSEENHPTDLFAFKINYNEVQDETNYTGKALYNGNIAETYWRTSADDIKRKYGYKYDDLNRLTDAVYQKPGNAVPVTNSYNESLTYDKNGNIMSLYRTGEFDDEEYVLEIDNLVYTYDINSPNQLKNVDDVSTHPAGFKDEALTGINEPDDYVYDANGNMISDVNKNIKKIKYNHLNLPVKIDFGDTGIITYIYNAIGQKLQKRVVNDSVVTVTDYIDGFQYIKEGDEAVKLLFFPHAEGYVNNTVADDVNNYNYVFNYKDHLGNVRLSYGGDSNGIGILEENNYYPFGLKHKNYNWSSKFYTQVETGEIMIRMAEALPYKYKYNGKELQDELGLNTYDYGARCYMSDIGRWGQIDPLAEMYRRHTPYAYAVNNPVYFLDPDGMKVINGNEAERDKALKERDTKKAEFNSKYSSGDMKRKDFSSKKEFKSYKSAKEGLAKSESNYKSAESRFQQTEATINEFKSVDPEGFAQVDNLKNGETGSNIDVVVKYGAVDPNSGGAETSPSVWPSNYSNQELGGDGNINITFDGSSKFGRGLTIAHEFGHAVGIAKEPYNSYTSARAAYNAARLFGKPASCQDPSNRHDTHVETAMDWQERFILLQKTMKP